MLQIRELRYAWPGGGREVLAIDRLDIAAGRKVFLHGPSGCGKSTLLGLMAGVLLARQGRTALLGQDWAALRASARDARRADHVGVVFQQFNLLPYLTVLDNVLLPCRFSRLRASRCAGSPLQAAKGLLERVALPHTAWTRRADALSVGQQQRVAAARALIGAPELVIADEPTSALDAALRDDFMAMLMQACDAAGSTLVFVSHDDRLAARFDERLSLPELNTALA
ncbi:Methionine ABC transporter ATP-binding protein [Rubrivivax sp. A210]|uniref:ATP-binding cassette domain-containing protein n=1 Tax=Rubrivivax sp. A210 TaxID=2772301 RepID=UPI001919397E|nr:ATP-binding cassette domain-containing protein [Rubrivivax sp. A210]CAD5374337.1 Methionine ABC transporter ATP-binding protein [Rubrivivax sp. A210]